MDPDIQAIVDQAKANNNAEAAAAKAFVDFAAIWQAKISAANSLSATDRAALQQTVTDMKTSADALAAGIVAGTPAA